MTIHELIEELRALPNQMAEAEGIALCSRMDAIRILKMSDYDTQERKWLEEFAELQKALLKSREENNRENVVEELADVFVCLEQIKVAHCISDDELRAVATEKIKRTLKLLRD